MRFSIKNISRAPRGVPDESGRLVMINPGQEKTVSLSCETFALMSSKRSFSIQAKERDEGPKIVVSGVSADALFTGEQLIAAIAEATGQEVITDEIQNLQYDLRSLGVKVDKRWGLERLKSELDKALSADNAVHTPDSE